MSNYIAYKNTNYIILADGTVARKLKPTQIHRQKYYNFIINNKQERVNVDDVMEIYNTANGIQNNSAEKA